MNELEELNEPSRFRTAMGVLFYSLACGLLLSIFSFVPGLFRYAFSLGALLLGIRFFRNYEKLSLRVIFIVLSIVFYFITAVIVSIVLFMQGMPVQDTALAPL
ncbi:hypothetical protein AB6A23_10845 [Paenibacillus tarimensis]